MPVVTPTRLPPLCSLVPPGRTATSKIIPASLPQRKKILLLSSPAAIQKTPGTFPWDFPHDRYPRAKAVMANANGGDHSSLPISSCEGRAWLGTFLRLMRGG